MAIVATLWDHRATMSQRDLLLLAEVRESATTGEAAEIRRKARLSQADMARAAGTTRSTISRWESGQRRPHGMPAVRWARLLRELERRKESA